MHLKFQDAKPKRCEKSIFLRRLNDKRKKNGNLIHLKSLLCQRTHKMQVIESIGSKSINKWHETRFSAPQSWKTFLHILIETIVSLVCMVVLSNALVQCYAMHFICANAHSLPSYDGKSAHYKIARFTCSVCNALFSQELNAVVELQQLIFFATPFIGI